ncbi:molecular chaperone DnaJ [Candidatus Nesciobacter abundans]|uniref:Chaperone protein DnaJ n=1 Tax=Candidatus Nesciobacter abundans TaxID=2601668 RepID=A0A5C0UFT7_9PROT|nr:molecular chaperone DnaJ [Candidatus Nesciobacter abundans]QEK38955.1 molecular chaperone DnaJ [Candidatus Nesciobacter abundans]
MSENFYDILGVSKNATDSEIKTAYLKKAKKYHPDSNKGNETCANQFKKVSEAYETLKDPKKRSMYDAGGSDPFGSGFGGHGNQYSQGNGSFDFEDIFSSFFGGQGGRQRQKRGEDLRFRVKLTLEQAFSGTKMTIKIPKTSSCKTCSGKGSSGPIEACSACNGKGTILMRHGFFHVESECSACKGRGKTSKNLCSTCKGSGIVKENKEISIEIPAGIENGEELRVPGEGNSIGSEGPNGDLFIQVGVSEHKLFSRERLNLHCTIKVSPVTLVMGGEAEVVSIDGKKISVKIPAGTQSESLLRIKKLGMQSRGRIGDLYIKVSTKIPSTSSMSSKEKALWKELSEMSDSTATSLLDSIKSMFKWK